VESENFGLVSDFSTPVWLVQLGDVVITVGVTVSVLGAPPPARGAWGKKNPPPPPPPCKTRVHVFVKLQQSRLAFERAVLVRNGPGQLYREVGCRVPAVFCMESIFRAGFREFLRCASKDP